jgi:hypothetical protein
MPRLPRGDDRGSFPAGTVGGGRLRDGGVHAIDGDGSSFCGRYTEDVLVRLDPAAWSDVPRARRCSGCQSFLSGLIGGAG